MSGYLRLLRPLNGAMAAIAVLIAVLITSAYQMPGSLRLDIVLAMVVVFLFIGAGNALNDYYDREVDRVNHPGRPLPSGKLRPADALRFSGALFASAIALSIFINLECLLLVLVNVGLMVSYELRLKSRGLSGTAVISWLTATIFLFGGLAVYENVEQLFRISTVSLLAFTASLGREIAKDVQDVEGDVGRTTLPKQVGTTGASAAAAALFTLTALLSMLPLWFGLFEFFYIPAILVADAIFIYCGTVLFENPKAASALAKAGMLAALAAFLVGGIGA